MHLQIYLQSKLTTGFLSGKLPQILSIRALWIGSLILEVSSINLPAGGCNSPDIPKGVATKPFSELNCSGLKRDASLTKKNVINYQK